eukprot:TRINITY_DN722_c0_g1_i2.p1 TRINITY_DN722_c0_g1~~TRINITY_DN722_c0_g1_i2.p1  ORF type:complete len:347 (-),score=100.33 TRINITY_DN722_c0_g1_i2:779-1819(-)
MVRQGHEDAAPPPELEPGSFKHLNQQSSGNDLKKKPFLLDDASRKIRLQGHSELLSGKFFIFESDPANPDTFHAIPIRDFYRFTTRPDLKEVTLEEAERILESKERAPRALGPAQPVPSGEEGGTDSPFTMGGLSVYGYRVRDEELESELKKGQEEDGEERDFAEKWDDDNPEDRIAVSVAERQQLPDEEKQLKKALRNTARLERKAPVDDDSDDEDSADEFARDIKEMEEPQYGVNPNETDGAAARGKKRKAEEEAAAPKSKRVKADPDHLSREDMLEEIKKILRARRLPKREFLATLKQRVRLEPAEAQKHNRDLMVEIVKNCVETHIENGVEVLKLKDDLFGK